MAGAGKIDTAIAVASTPAKSARWREVDMESGSIGAPGSRADQPNERPNAVALFGLIMAVAVGFGVVVGILISGTPSTSSSSN